MNGQISETERQLFEATVKGEAYKVNRLIYFEADVNKKQGKVNR